MKKKGFKTLNTGRLHNIGQYVLQPKVRSLLPSNMTQNFTNFQINFDQVSNQGTPVLSNFTDACSLNI